MINFATSFDSSEQLSVREAGLPAPKLPDIDPKDRSQLPAGGGEWPVPPHLGFISLVGMSWRAHHYASDEAIRHSRQNADAMLKDLLVLSVLEERFRSASQLSWHIEPLDESDNAQMRAAAINTLAVAKTCKLQEAFYQWNWAKWYGKYALEMLYKWDDHQPDLMYCRDWTPINGDSLVPRYANSDWGRLVNSLYDGPTEPYALGRVHWYTPEEMESVVVHSYHPTQPDFFDGLASGALRGRGLRHGAYWMWFYRSNLLALLMDYLERLSGGVWKGLYDESNPQARTDLEQAVAAYKSKSLLMLPKRKDGSLPNDVQIMEVGTASPAVLNQTIDYIDRLLRGYLSGRPNLSGSVGGDEVALQEGAISAVTKADAVGLAEDLTNNWLPTLYRYNSRGVPNGRFVFDTDHPNAEKMLQYAQILRDMGWAVDLGHLAKIAGLPPGGLDNQISTKIQSLNPVAVSDVPQGVPIAGQPVAAPQAAPPQPAPQAPPVQ